MSETTWTETQTKQAKQIWEQYQKHNQIEERIGQTAGIDPENGQVWFGESIQDIVQQRKAQGVVTPLFFVRVGSETYLTKGRHS